MPKLKACNHFTILVQRWSSFNLLFQERVHEQTVNTVTIKAIKGKLEDVTTKRDGSATGSSRNETERDESVSERDEDMNERDESVTERDEDVTERDEKVTTVQKIKITKKADNKNVTKRDGSVSERDGSFVDDSVTDRDESMADRDETVTDRDEDAENDMEDENDEDDDDENEDDEGEGEGEAEAEEVEAGRKEASQYINRGSHILGDQPVKLPPGDTNTYKLWNPPKQRKNTSIKTVRWFKVNDDGKISLKKLKTKNEKASNNYY